MKIHIQGVENKLISGHLSISGSKSKSNRLLILQKLFPEIAIENVSDSDDTHHLQEALSTKKNEINIGHAGTAMRFLTAFFAIQKGRMVIISGSDRMHNRPIQILVGALKDLGADISYIDKGGYPPLKISGKKLTKDFVKIRGNVSSQYISALLLIATRLTHGLTIELLGEITSIPYINMTLSLLNQLGVETYFENQIIKVKPLRGFKKQSVVVESDWSSASYFYSVAALSSLGSEITLSSYKKESLQGDAVLAAIYEYFGVKTIFKENTIVLKKVAASCKKPLEIDLNKAPDIAQTIAVTCFGLQIGCRLTGLHTLKIKEADRLEALKNELTKLGADITVTNERLDLKPASKIHSGVAIETYHDHRMAMAFAPLGLLTSLYILDANVVTKSYRNFWQDMKQLGYILS